MTDAAGVGESSLTRVLFVFDWLVIGGEETEVRLLARTLDPQRYEIQVLACFDNGRMSPLTTNRLRDIGVPLDTCKAQEVRPGYATRSYT